MNLFFTSRSEPLGTFSLFLLCCVVSVRGMAVEPFRKMLTFLNVGVIGLYKFLPLVKVNVRNQRLPDGLQERSSQGVGVFQVNRSLFGWRRWDKWHRTSY